MNGPQRFRLQDPDQLLLAQLQQRQKRHQHAHAPLFGAQHLLQAQGLAQGEHGEDLRHPYPGRDLLAADLVMFKMSRAFYHTLHVKGEFNQRNIGRQWLQDTKIRRHGGGDEDLPLHPRQGIDPLRPQLVALVLLQATNEGDAGIFSLLLVFQLRGLGQQQAGLYLREPGRHQQVFRRQLEVEALHQIHVLHVLGGDLQDGQVEDVELLAPDEVEQEIQRPLEGVEKHLQRIGGDEQVLGQLMVGLPQHGGDGRGKGSLPRRARGGCQRGHGVGKITQTASDPRHRGDAARVRRRRSPPQWWAARPDTRR